MKKVSIIRDFAKLVVFSSLLTAGCQTPGPQTNTRMPHLQSTRPMQEAAIQNAPKQIALMLPLSGGNANSANAIKEGVFASFYASNQQPKPNIRMYDTANQNVMSVYELAVAEGAEMVIGPLAKDEVMQLSRLSSSQLRAPVLALNEHPMAYNTSSQFVQYSLSPEIEAHQIALKARSNGYQTASVIVPNNNWGKRIASTFASQFQQMGGHITNTVYTNPQEEQSTYVKRLLDVKLTPKNPDDPTSDKIERAQIQSDMIMMAASPDLARQIKPLINFYFAENVPVLATSSIYSGTPDARRDRDLNGIQFCDMPCLIEPHQGAAYQQMLNQQANQGPQYARLFAMGMDAYHLSERMSYLKNNHFSHYSGATGYLSIDNQNRVQRQLPWAKIRGGVPIPVS